MDKSLEDHENMMTDCYYDTLSKLMNVPSDQLRKKIKSKDSFDALLNFAFSVMENPSASTDRGLSNKTLKYCLILQLLRRKIKILSANAVTKFILEDGTEVHFVINGQNTRLCVTYNETDNNKKKDKKEYTDLEGVVNGLTSAFKALLSSTRIDNSDSDDRNTEEPELNDDRITEEYDDTGNGESNVE